MNTIQLAEMTRRVFPSRTLRSPGGAAAMPLAGCATRSDSVQPGTVARTGSSATVPALLGPDQPAGQVHYPRTDDGRVVPTIDYVMTAEWQQRRVRGMTQAGELLFAAGAREIALANPSSASSSSPGQLLRCDQFPIEPGLATFVSARKQGACRSGSSEENSVVDQNLRLHTADNIYVMHASVMPSSASKHVMIPIMVAAEFAVDRMLES